MNIVTATASVAPMSIITSTIMSIITSTITSIITNTITSTIMSIR